jgi:hypothetical protein
LGEPADDGEYDYRTNSAGHAGACNLTKRYRLVGWDDDGAQERRRDREHKRVGASRQSRRHSADP